MDAEPRDVGPIGRPEDLDLPAESEAVLDRLTDAERAAFSKEMVHALIEAKHRGDLRPVQEVVGAWYRTLLFRNTAGYGEAVAWARTSEPGPGVPAEQVVSELLGR